MKKFSRVFIGPESPTRSNIIRTNIKVYTNQTFCRSEIVYLKSNTRDIQSAIKFRVNYTIVEPPLPLRPLTKVPLHPILDQTEAERTFIATFQKDCGNDDVCETTFIVGAQFELDYNNLGNLIIININ